MVCCAVSRCTGLLLCSVCPVLFVFPTFSCFPPTLPSLSTTGRVVCLFPSSARFFGDAALCALEQVGGCGSIVFCHAVYTVWCCVGLCGAVWGCAACAVLRGCCCILLLLAVRCTSSLCGAACVVLCCAAGVLLLIVLCSSVLCGLALCSASHFYFADPLLPLFRSHTSTSAPSVDPLPLSVCCTRGIPLCAGGPVREQCRVK